jgi:hypothetical protein
MGEMKQPEIIRRQHQQRAADPRHPVVQPAARERSAMDALVQRAEQKAQHGAVQDECGREPRLAAACPHEQPRRGQQPRVDGKLQEAERVRAAREPPHGLALETPRRQCIDFHDVP